MLILAIDTSTEQASIGLSEGTTVRAEWSWSAAGNHSQHLSKLVEALFQVEKIRPADVQAITVASGPGSFSGLRVGVSFAKGVALALGIPLTGVGTLDMIGYASSCLADDLLASIPAGGGRLYVAAFDGGAQRFRRRGETRIMRAAEAAEMASEASLVCGPGAGEIAVELEQRGLSPRLPPPAWRLRRSGFLAELGRRYFEGGGADQVDTLEPQYVRRSSAEEKRFGSQE